MQHFYSALADIIVSALNIQEGQCLAVKCEPVHTSFLPVLSRHTYKAGARYVEFLPDFSALTRSRIDYSSVENLDFTPRYLPSIDREIVEDNWAYLSIKSPDDPEIMAGASVDRLAAVRMAASREHHYSRSSLSENKARWLVVALPTEPWARRVLENDPNAGEEFTRILASLYRLDEPEPKKFRQSYTENLSLRAKALTDLSIRKLTFKGDGTDLHPDLCNYR